MLTRNHGGGWSPRLRSLENALVSVWNYRPAGDGVTDDSTALQNALDSGAQCVDLGSTGTFRAQVTVPAGVTLRGDGAALIPAAPSATNTAVVRTGGDGARIVGVRFDASDDAGLIGGESCLIVGHSSVEVQSCQFIGNGFRYGVRIRSAIGGPCDEVTIADNRFDTTSYAVFKDGSNGTGANRLVVRDNRFVNIRRGDAIEINLGADVGTTITGNNIDGVFVDGVAAAGLGIGVAGPDTYDTVEGLVHGAFLIANNVVRNTEGEAIHVEAAARFRIVNNILGQGGALSGTGYGVSVYGGLGGVIKDNTITGFETGIIDDLGVNDGSYAVSTGDMVIRHNLIRGCGRGIHEGVSGTNRDATVAANDVHDCGTGIDYTGNGIVIITDNIVKGCDLPYSIDANPTSRSGITSTTRVVRLLRNQAYTADGADQAASNTYANTAGATVTASGNNFTSPT